VTAAAFDPGPLPRLAPRRPEAHKGEFGRVLLLGGSRGLVGAAALAADAAARTGAGLVTVGCPRSVYPILAAKLTNPMTWPLSETEAESLAEEAAEPILERARREFDAVAIGPGLGRHPSTRRLARSVIERLEIPWVADADALFALAEDLATLERARAVGILTPHAGEMARLVGSTPLEVQAHREQLARGFAARFPHVLLLKGHGTLVALGERLARNPTGNPGMATGGMGDVLTGAIVALLGQKLSPWDAARLGAYVHGRAGDIARDEVGEVGLVATDLVARLPRALREVGAAGGA